MKFIFEDEMLHLFLNGLVCNVFKRIEIECPIHEKDTKSNETFQRHSR